MSLGGGVGKRSTAAEELDVCWVVWRVLSEVRRSIEEGEGSNARSRSLRLRTGC